MKLEFTDMSIGVGELPAGFFQRRQDAANLPIIEAPEETTVEHQQVFIHSVTAADGLDGSAEVDMSRVTYRDSLGRFVAKNAVINIEQDRNGWQNEVSTEQVFTLLDAWNNMQSVKNQGDATNGDNLILEYANYPTTEEQKEFESIIKSNYGQDAKTRRVSSNEIYDQDLEVANDTVLRHSNPIKIKGEALEPSDGLDNPFESLHAKSKKLKSRVTSSIIKRLKRTETQSSHFSMRIAAAFILEASNIEHLNTTEDK